MAGSIRLGEHTFESYCDRIDVTSRHRPDPSWKLVDLFGHVHQWYEKGSTEPASSYRPDKSYEVPTLIWKKDGEEFWEGDNGPHPVGHFECRECLQYIEPRYTADFCPQYIPGLHYYLIDNMKVTEEEFRRRLTEAHEKGRP